MSIRGNVSRSTTGVYPFKVEVRQTTMDKIAHKQPYYHGHYDNPKQYVCSGVSISLNNRPVKIPEAACSDLCYLQGVEPPEHQDDGTWLVSIYGGSAGESYEVALIFDRSKLLERRLFHLVPERKLAETRKF